MSNITQYQRGLLEKNVELQQKNAELIGLAETSARAEREYNIALATKMLELKEQKQSISILKDVAKGDGIVADLRFKADVANAIYNACREAIKDIRENIGSYRTLISSEKMEYGNAA